MNPKVSVVVTVYNGEDYLEECLDSIINQTLKEIEIICVDDGSRDNSLNILERYSEYDNRVIVLQQENQGAGPARNFGMSIAKGEYIIFLDCDDVFELTMMEKMYLECQKYDLDLVVCRSNQFKSNDTKVIDSTWTIKTKLLPQKKVFSAQEIEKDFFMVFVWWAWDKLYKKSFIDELGLRFQSLRTTNDLYFSVCTTMMAKRISYIEDVLVHHRTGGASSLSVTRERSWDCFYYALIEMRKFMEEKGLYKRFEQDYVNYCLHFSMWHLNTVHGYSYCLLYNALRTGWFNEWGINSKNEEYFYDKNLFKRKEYIMATDVEHHLCNRILELEKLLENKKQSRSVDSFSNESNLEKVKRYYKHHGLKDTIRKIIEKITS